MEVKLLHKRTPAGKACYFRATIYYYDGKGNILRTYRFFIRSTNERIDTLKGRTRRRIPSVNETRLCLTTVVSILDTEAIEYFDKRKC